MVTREYEYILRIKTLHIIYVLENRIGGSGIPVGLGYLFIRRKNGYSTYISVKIPGDTDTDMRIKTKWLILCQNSDSINT